MSKLKVLAGGSSPQAQAQARGKLFENLMAEVLRHYGFVIDRTPNVNYSGMEIDIQGRQISTSIPLYAECKCYEKEVDVTHLQAFYGKYMTLWRRDKRSQGLFIALPGVNSHAKAFYRDNCELDTDTTVLLYDEQRVLEAIFDTSSTVRPEIIARLVTEDFGLPGDWILLYTDKGLFWVQYVIPKNSGIPDRAILCNSQGHLISDQVTIDYLMQLYSSLNDVKLITTKGIAAKSTITQQDAEEIVEVVGSSSCFEYQFPASPEHFVGRKSTLEIVGDFTQDVLNNKTSARGLLFQGNSGWGKSSVVLESVARLQETGHFALAIDSRTVSSSQFILRVVDHTFRKYGEFDGLLTKNKKLVPITGLDGAIKSLIEIGRILEKENKLLCIFLDQFENVFFQHDALKCIRDLFLKICDAQTNVCLAFSWKSDLFGSMNDFPYHMRGDIMNGCKRLDLEPFSEEETAILLERLSKELGAPLRNDLKFFLTDFSQGYPWLLKKLCNHVKIQLDSGVFQSKVAGGLLNVEELFKEDLRGLSTKEEDTLRQIARLSPISVRDLDEDFQPEIVQSLVNKRLLKRIGNKYDVSWDIFRDYLNFGLVPVQENYILHAKFGSVFRTINILFKSNGEATTADLQRELNLKESTFYLVIRDMKFLGLVEESSGRVRLQVKSNGNEKDFDDSLGTHLRDRLRRNRLVSRLIESLGIERSLTIEHASTLLAEWCPYISPKQQTWRLYASTFATWCQRLRTFAPE